MEYVFRILILPTVLVCFIKIEKELFGNEKNGNSKNAPKLLKVHLDASQTSLPKKSLMNLPGIQFQIKFENLSFIYVLHFLFFSFFIARNQILI